VGKEMKMTKQEALRQIESIRSSLSYADGLLPTDSPFTEPVEKIIEVISVLAEIVKELVDEQR